MSQCTQYAEIASVPKILCAEHLCLRQKNCRTPQFSARTGFRCYTPHGLCNVLPTFRRFVNNVFIRLLNTSAPLRNIMHCLHFINLWRAFYQIAVHRRVRRLFSVLKLNVILIFFLTQHISLCFKNSNFISNKMLKYCPFNINPNCR